MEIALLCCYAALLMYISRRTAGREDGARFFFVNDRASGAVTVALSLIVSCVGASATMGMAGKAFAVGAPAFWWLGAGAAGITVLAFLLAAKVRESGSYTMPEMAAQLLGPRARPLISSIIVVAWMAILAAQFLAMSKLLGPLTGLGSMTCLAIAYALIVLHTLGGQAVVLRTDRLQSVILFAGLGLLAAWLNALNPGWTAHVRLEAVNDKFTPGDLMHYLFVVGGNYLVCPMLFGRFFSARDGRTARNGGLLAGVGLILSAVLIVMVGLACRGIVPDATVPDAVLTTAINTALPRWLALVVLLALISAVVSSADSCLITAGTILSYDLLGTEKTASCRRCVVALGTLGAAMTFMDRDILGFLFMAYDIYVAGVVMPIFIVLALSSRRVVRPMLPLVAIVGGGALGCLATAHDAPELSYTGMVFSSLLTYLGLGKREYKGKKAAS